MKQTEKFNIIFLNIDGVLNGNNSRDGKFWHFCDVFNFLGLYNLIKSIFKIPDAYHCIHQDKFSRLLTIIKATNAKLVITDSKRFDLWSLYWKNRKPEEFDHDPELDELLSLLDKNNIGIFDITEKDSYKHRKENEILNWLSKHEDIVKNFVILDSNYEGLELFSSSDVVLTSDADFNHKNKRNKYYCNEGLQSIHVADSINILKGGFSQNHENNNRGDQKRARSN